MKFKLLPILFFFNLHSTSSLAFLESRRNVRKLYQKRISTKYTNDINSTFMPRKPVLLRNTLKMMRPEIEMKSSLYSTSKVTVLNPTTDITQLTQTTVVTNVVQSLEQMINDPHFEAAVLRDMAHLALDLTNFIPQVALFTRSLAVIGRVMSILSDYIPDHQISPDELGFQISMLAISIQLLARNVMPLLKALSEPPLYRDKRAYCLLFRQAGLSWLQFKMVRAAAFDWVEIQPQATIVFPRGDDKVMVPELPSLECGDEEECLYWLYDGDVEIDINGSSVDYIQKKKGNTVCDGKEQNDINFFGHFNYDRTPIQYQKPKHGLHDRKNIDYIDRQPNIPMQEKIRAGEHGAVLLKINSGKLSTLMDGDATLFESVQFLLLKDMQQKVVAKYPSKI